MINHLEGPVKKALKELFFDIIMIEISVFSILNK